MKPMLVKVCGILCKRTFRRQCDDCHSVNIVVSKDARSTRVLNWKFKELDSLTEVDG